MSAWLSILRQEWTVISAAPIALALAIVVPAAITWAIVDVTWRSALADSNAEIARYSEALGGASPLQAGENVRSLREQLAMVQKELAELQSPDRDPNAVYQHGRRIGTVDGIEIDASNTSVTFQRMTVDRELAQATNVEFRDFVLSLGKYAALTRVAQGPAAIYHSPRFAVVGRRGDCVR
jgi:hypothetical protein